MKSPAEMQGIWKDNEKAVTITLSELFTVYILYVMDSCALNYFNARQLHPCNNNG